MKKTKFARILCLLLCAVMACASFVACEDPGVTDSADNGGGNSGGGNTPKRDSIVIMTEELSGLFNPFYATSGADMGVVGLTQIGMLTTDKNGNSVAGDDYDTVVKDFKYEIKNNSGNTETVYTFVLKNGLKFSDGVPLTMNDVLFSMYENLDPVYTGSSTMYSIKIKGLSQYRLQKNYSGTAGDEYAAMLEEEANEYAKMRRDELVDVYTTNGKTGGDTSTSYSLDQAGMRNAIANWFVTDGYKSAVASDAEQATLTEDDYRAMLLEDYENALKLFKEEVESDYKAAKESFDLTTMPYSEWADFLASDITKFLVHDGYITPDYHKNMGKTDRTKIDKWSGDSILKAITTEQQAINRVYNDKVTAELNIVLKYWGTAGKLLTQYAAKAMDIKLHSDVVEGELAYPNISGIVSLGHTTSTNSVTINGKEYAVAHQYNADGTVKNSNEYAVLQITVDGTDPKAIFNFSFTVAPVHYYTADAEHPNGRTVDIANNKFGVEWSSSEFQSKVIQSQQHVEIPVGAGAFKATDINNSDNPAGSAFVSSNIVYYKANENFMFPVKAKKLRMQVVSSSNAIDKLLSGEVDYVTPQFTKANSERLNQLESQGYGQLNTWQLGYGYIGVNAGKVEDINVRKAIMASMQTSLALEFYANGTCTNIDWPMSRVSWAYPFEDDGVTSKPNGKDYMQWNGVDAAIRTIQKYCPQPYTEKLVFTIAGASITEHPTYPVFKQAAEILNSLGWNVEVKADSQALVKLSTGSLAVWAAAWGSTIDPDMYQVYHKISTATSVYSWGYREIKNDKSKYSEEWAIINELSALIEDGRETMDQSVRIPIYEEAMSLVLDLAVEMPVYQRKTLYAYNGNTIKGLNKDVNPYSSPLEKIWELELA